MKRLVLLAAFLLITSPAYPQATNTFPASGDAGIGTTTPTDALEVYETNNEDGITILNSSSTTAQYPSLTISNYAGTTGGFGDLSFFTARGSVASPSAIQSGDYLGGILAAGYGASATDANAAAIEFIADGTFTNASGPGDIAFSTTPSGSADALSERMRITSSGLVGIGTTAPATVLDVRSTGDDAYFYRNTADIYGPLLRLRKSRGTISSPGVVDNGDISGVFSFEGYDGAAYQAAASIIGVVNGTVASGSVPTDMAFYAGTSSGGTERMRITSSGNVGIGTTSPGQLLEVHGGNLSVTNPASSNTGLALVNNTANGNTYWWISDTGGNLDLWNSTKSTYPLFISGSNGDVGIDNTSPSYALDVTGSIRTTQALLNSSAVPTISSCGTSPPAATTGSNNNSGQFTFGTGSPTACTVTFANAFPTYAFCTVTPTSNYTGTYRISSTAGNKSSFTVTLGTGTSSATFNYTCLGN